MNGVNSPDFSEYQNRSAISKELMNNTLSDLGIILIRVITYMEVTNHPDRQSFWEFLENICKEKRHGQMVLGLDTRGQNETVIEQTEKVLDKSMPKV